jgi:uncharacterized membrane protein YkoI
LLYNATSGFKPRKTMKFTEIRIYLIFSISFFLILGMSAQNDLIFDKANADSIILTSNNVPPSADSTSIKPIPLFTNSNSHNLQIQSLNNATSLLDTSIIERNWTGSIPTFPTIMQAFKSQIKTGMNEATTAALSAVGRNSTAISSILQPERGFLVYIVRVVDFGNQIHSVVVDAGNGNVLSNTLVPTLDLAKVRSGPVSAIGPLGGPAGTGYAMPPLPPLLPNSITGFITPPLPPPFPNSGTGFVMPPLSLPPNPGGLVQPMQPPPPTS